MRIERKYSKENIQQLFFPVVERPLAYYDSSLSNYLSVPKHKALVDAEKGTVLSVVSNRYKVVTNEEAYKIVRPVASAFFGGNGFHNFECFNLFVPKSRASCRIDFTRRGIADFDVCGDKYLAFIRMANSYNRTSRLMVTIGFCRWMCMNGCIFGEKSFTFSVEHSDSRLMDPNFIAETVEEATKSIGDVATEQKEIYDALMKLKGFKLSRDDMRKLFCKVFDLNLNSKTLENLNEERKKRLVDISTRLEELVSSYVEEFGETAYAGYNVLTDYASYNTNGQAHSVYMPAQQVRVGNWLKEFSMVVDKSDFSLEEYLNDYDETRRMLASLIEKR